MNIYLQRHYKITMVRSIPEIERVWTVLDVVQWGAEFFTRKGIESARLNIELMLCNVLQVARLKLYTDHERPLSKDELGLLRSMVQRRVAREPLQYILGSADFYGLRYSVSPKVLIPRPETELLVERCIRVLRSTGETEAQCLDIGTGSGCIPISVAVNHQTCTWTGVDLSESALDVARVNAKHHAVSDRCSWIKLDVLTEDIAGKFNVITMNPPYIPAIEIADLEPEVRDYEPLSALTDNGDGLLFFRRLAEILPGTLLSGGVSLMEIGFGQAGAVKEIMSSVGTSVEIVDDLAGIPRLIVVHA